MPFLMDMDFSKFRQSGDLSDVTVVVGDKNYRLHKFPLFAKSEFFGMVARTSEDDTNRVELQDFPGGHVAFELVADFCYNVPINITKENVVELRCAAQFLQMAGDGNLSDLTEKFLHDAITSVKLTRSTATVAELLRHCVSTGVAAERVGIVDQCLDALLECWLRPSTMFTSPSHSPRPFQTNPQLKNKNLSLLTDLPEEWFVKMLSKGKEKGVDQSYLVTAAQEYLSVAMASDLHQQPTGVDESEKAEEEGAEKDDAAGDNGPTVPNPENPLPQPTDRDNGSEKMAKLLDMVLLELPADISLANHVTADWVIRSLKIATSHNCKCTNILIRAAGELLKTLSPDELCSMSPSVIHDIIAESIAFKPDAEVYASSCALLDLYLQILTDKSQLTSDTFKLLAGAVPAEHRESDDQLYNALEFVLKSEKATLPEDVYKDLLHRVDLRCVDDTTLERALDEGVVPAEPIARAALDRCQQLRAELDSTRASDQPDDNYPPEYSQRFSDNSLGLNLVRPSRPPPIPRSSGTQSTASEQDCLKYQPISGRDHSKSDLDSVPVRVKAVPPYAYRPINDLDLSYGEDHDFRVNQWSTGNLRAPRTSYPSAYHRHHRTYSHRL